MLSKQEIEQFAQQIFKFHTKQAPGLYIGILMVDYAREALGTVKGKMNAITETQACLSDVVQVMTGCTMGNRYLRVMKDIGRFALVLFDREDGRGIRVSVDLSKINPTEAPEMYKFFHRTRDPKVNLGGPEREASGKKIIQEFEKLGRELFILQKVLILEHGKPPMLPAKICPTCRETFLQRDETHAECDFCSGTHKYYDQCNF
ncbi:formylmethanofuran dehydrogenase subunit E family protein [bacterium]|nr:formylmethanofuran dehydrogenase subunit E family protein [bacterium]